ncbi:T9SS type A sorting domain-containing protein [Psychroserpens sp. S379A]|uniref:T9SS type A sorting domain-containing protein n=1 Tax=Psychroserpens sp. S379A TaxID=3415137 RepID=UPI003C7E0BA8
MKKLLLFLTVFCSFTALLWSQNTPNTPNDILLCDIDGSGFAEFDLHINDAIILDGLDNPDQYVITYHETATDANNGTNALSSPYTNITNPQEIRTRVEHSDGGTVTVYFSQFFLIAGPSPSYTWTFPMQQCDTGGGYATFDLTQLEQEFMNGNSNVVLTYYETYEDALNEVNAITNENFYTNTTPYTQDIYIRATDLLSGCFFVNNSPALILNVGPFNVANNPTPYVVCDTDDDGIEVFNLDTKTNEILGGNQNPTLLVTYHLNQAEADGFFNVLDPIFTNTIPFAQTLYVRVSQNTGDCYDITTLDLVVDTDCVSASSVEAFVCSEDSNTPTDYDLTIHEAEILNGQNSSDFTITYYMSETNAIAEVNPITNPQAYAVNSNSEVYVRVENQSGSYTVVVIFINYYLNPQIDFNGPYTICGGNDVVLYPVINNNNGAYYDYLWSTGETSPEIVVNMAGVYSVTVTDLISGCVSTASVEVIEGGIIPVISQPENMANCEPIASFDLTSTIPEILNGLDANQFVINFFEDYSSANSNTNPIVDATNYMVSLTTETIFVRVQNSTNECFSITDFSVTSDGSCPAIVDCAQPVTNSFCYDNSSQQQYIYESADGTTPLQVVFNAGQVENNFDELVVLDSNGTNLNANSPYGNQGDVSGLMFTSSGSTITIMVASDVSVSCQSQNYTPINYEVSCADPNALPSCNVMMLTPENGEVDVNENTNITWSNASGVVVGYKLSIGITPGGTEVLDNLDVGNVLSYETDTFEYEVTYYITITPYNNNGNAEDCIEKSFTTRANPNQIVVCEDGTVNTTYCYDNNDTTEFSFQSSDGLPLTLYFNAGGTEVTYDEVYIIDSDGTILNPDLEYGNNGDFAGLTYTSLGDSLTVRFNTDGSVSCANGNACCTEQFDFDVFCTSSVGIIDVNAFIDDNANGVFDANEFNFSNGYFTYEVNGDGMLNTVNSSTGNFQIISENDTDVYEITFNLYDESAGCYEVTSATFSNISVTEGNTVTVDFPVVEEQSCEDLAVYLINYWTPPRPGFSHENFLVLENLGFTTITSGTVEFVADSQLVYNNVTSVNPNYTITNTATGFTVDFVNLQPGDVEYIDISLTCPATVDLDDIVTNTATYVTDANDLVPGNNYSTLSEVVIGSWDPNDKMESHGPKVLFDDFSTSDEWLYYTVRFQNLGTAAAEFVRIEDVLDNQLDETTFQMLRSSHDYVVTRTENNLEWYFEDINLPAEQDDAEGSNGFIYFRVKPKAGYALGDIIPNTAAIYFDFNAPVITNRFETEFVDEALSVSEFDYNGFDMHPNPANDVLNIKLNNISNANLRVYDIQGKLVIERPISNEQNLSLNVSNLQSGLYFVKLNTSTKEMVKKLIID